MNLKTKKITILLALLALLPDFFIAAAAKAIIPDLNQNKAQTIIANFSEIPAQLYQDPRIISLQKVFPFPTNAQFANVYRINSSYSPAQFKTQYAGNILYANAQQKIKLQTTNVNDPGFAVNSIDTDHLWALNKARFTEAWDKTKGSASVKIGIIDTGVDGTHEDLASGQVIEGFNFLTSSLINSGTNSDDNGHGTLVAGVIAATPNNFRGIAGAAFNVAVIPLKTLDDKGSGNSEDIAAAIIWAADHGANIINMSLGGNGFANDTTLSNAVTYAFNKNVLLVAAAGNDVATTGGNMDTNPVYPICNDNGQNMILGVAATDVNDQKASFSNYGQSCVDVSAPGKRILSTISFDPVTNKVAPNSYAYASGTSLAAPFVSAEAALIKSYYPDATNREIRNRIIKSAESVDIYNQIQCNNAPCTNLLGSGRINAFKALDSALVATAKIADGDLALDTQNNKIYYISGGQKRPVSDFVLKQRFVGIMPISVSQNDLATIATGPAATPLENTIIKTAFDATVYQIIDGFRRPFNYAVFLQRKIQPAQITMVSSEDLDSWLPGKFVPPAEGTLVKTDRDPTVYWVVDSLLHPVNYQFWLERGLSIFPIMIIPNNDIKNFVTGNAYIR